MDGLYDRRTGLLHALHAPAVDLDQIYAKALRRARAATDLAGQPRTLPGACPFTLDELLTGARAELLAKWQMPGE